MSDVRNWGTYWLPIHTWAGVYVGTGLPSDEALAMVRFMERADQQEGVCDFCSRRLPLIAATQGMHPVLACVPCYREHRLDPRALYPSTQETVIVVASHDAPLVGLGPSQGGVNSG